MIATRQGKGNRRRPSQPTVAATPPRRPGIPDPTPPVARILFHPTYPNLIIKMFPHHGEAAKSPQFEILNP
ncbi:hypothetical protein [Azospirillum argentinense]